MSVEKKKGLLIAAVSTAVAGLIVSALSLNSVFITTLVYASENQSAFQFAITLLIGVLAPASYVTALIDAILIMGYFVLAYIRGKLIWFM